MNKCVCPVNEPMEEKERVIAQENHRNNIENDCEKLHTSLKEKHITL